MKLTILLLCVLIAITSVESRRKRKYKKAKDPLKYHGCKPEDTICEKRPQRYCKFRSFRHQCPRKCGKCVPFEPKCPKEYKFGCCWDGTPRVNDTGKGGCPECSDVNEAICKRAVIRKDCNFSKQTRITRFLCPLTCGACGDFGNGKAFSPPRICKDADERCYKIKDKSCCKDNEILQDLCRKTCGMCLPNYK